MKKLQKHDSQRGWFAYTLYQQMKKDKNIVLLCLDLGYKVFDQHFEDFPDRCFNLGASEQAGMGIAVGMALEGKKVFVYTITSFFLRAAETINLYLHHEQIPVKMVGSGAFDDYQLDGYSHNATIAQNYLESLKIEKFCPEKKEEIPQMVKKMIKNNKPSFILLRR